MSMSKPQKMALLRRRKNYLEKLDRQGRANEYDRGEIAALRWALELLERIENL